MPAPCGTRPQSSGLYLFSSPHLLLPQHYFSDSKHSEFVDLSLSIVVAPVPGVYRLEWDWGEPPPPATYRADPISPLRL